MAEKVTGDGRMKTRSISDRSERVSECIEVNDKGNYAPRAQVF